jgi:hypothetical protein
MLVFLLCLLSNFTERSIEFNLIVAAAFLAKALFGTSLRKSKSFHLLRTYIMKRLALDCALILPLIVFYKTYSATSSNNLLIVLGVLTLSEVGILLTFGRFLFKKSKIECIEDLQPSQGPDFISHFNSRKKSIVTFINTYRASKFIVSKLKYSYWPELVPSYIYFKPKNGEQQRRFNHNRIEFEDDL